MATLGSRATGTIGELVAVVLDVKVAPGNRVARDENGNLLADEITVRIKDAWSGYVAGQTRAERELSVRLQHRAAWSEYLNPGTPQQTWSTPGASCPTDGNVAGTRRRLFRSILGVWDTKKGPTVEYKVEGVWQSIAGVPPMGHNGAHSVRVVAIDGDVEHTTIPFQSYDVLEDTWSAPVACGPAWADVTVKNLVVTALDATHGNVDYFKYDPDPESPFNRPRIEFTFDDAVTDGYTYHAWVLIQKTGRAGMEFVRHEDMYAVADTYIQGPVATPGAYYTIWDGSIIATRDLQQRTYTLSGPDEAEWSTYTYDVIVAKYAGGTLVDQFAFKWPYCLSIGDHTAEVIMDDGGVNDSINYSYVVTDLANERASEYPNAQTPNGMQMLIVIEILLNETSMISIHVLTAKRVLE